MPVRSSPASEPLPVDETSQTGFLDIDRCHEVLAPFEARWRDLADEAEQMHADGWLKHPDSYYAPSGWQISCLRYFGIDNPHVVAAAPVLAELVAQDRRVMNAMYLRLKPGAEIAAHHGRPVGTGRFHLGLAVPDDCWLQVAGTRRTWVEGGWLAFDDALEHSAWNHSDRERVILQLDFEHPEIEMPRGAYASRFAQGFYYGLVLRHPRFRHGVMWFNKTIRNALRPLDRSA